MLREYFGLMLPAALKKEKEKSILRRMLAHSAALTGPSRPGVFTSRCRRQCKWFPGQWAQGRNKGISVIICVFAQMLGQKKHVDLCYGHFYMMRLRVQPVTHPCRHVSRVMFPLVLRDGRPGDK